VQFELHRNSPLYKEVEFFSDVKHYNNKEIADATNSVQTNRGGKPRRPKNGNKANAPDLQAVG
jgi:hypothetical protein